MMLVDLHTHSKASDGSMSPAELVGHAADRGLSAIAITDHDTIDGVSEAVEEGIRRGIEVIPGLEISVDFEPEMHILGYFFNNGCHAIEPALEELHRKRQERNPKIIRKLREMGFDITLEEAVKLAGGKVVGRPHIAAAMVQRGYVSNAREAFDNYLASGKPAFFKKDKLTPQQGIEMILRADGVPVLAHPVLLGMENRRLDQLLGKLAAAGLKGAEAIYVENSEEQTEFLIEMCRKHHLIVTGGSDFHGEFKPDIEIGTGKGNLRIPYQAVEELKLAAAEASRR